MGSCGVIGTTAFSRTASVSADTAPGGGRSGSLTFRFRPSPSYSGSIDSEPSSTSWPSPVIVRGLRSVPSPKSPYPSLSAMAARRAEVSMKAGSTRCTARYRGSAAAERPVPSCARASQ